MMWSLDWMIRYRLNPFNPTDNIQLLRQPVIF